MKRLLTKTTYLEMLAPPATNLPPPTAGARIERLRSPTPQDYRSLYDAVGRTHYWVDRNSMPDGQLLAILGDPLVEIDVLYVGGETAGYVELDRRMPGEIELAYFGLLPAFLGKGLGKYLLSWGVQRAWSFAPRRVWVHTCDLDHPAALPNYLKAGFVVYDEKVIEQMVPEE